jgi:hypothetical protein
VIDEKSTTWVLGKTGEQAALSRALSELIDCETEAAKLEVRAKLAKAKLVSYCEDRWCREVAQSGRKLPTPIKLVTPAGRSATFVIQDRTGSTRINASVYDELCGVIGRKTAKNATVEKKVIYFSDEVLDQVALDGRTVCEATEEYLDLMAKDMVVQKVITEAQAKALFEITPVRTFIGNFLAYLPGMCDLDAEKFTAAIKAIGSAVTRYIKV